MEIGSPTSRVVMSDCITINMNWQSKTTDCSVDTKFASVHSTSYRLDLEDGGKRLVYHPPLSLIILSVVMYSVLDDANLNHESLHSSDRKTLRHPDFIYCTF